MSRVLACSPQRVCRVAMSATRGRRGRLVDERTIDRTIVWENHAFGGMSPRHKGAARWRTAGGKEA